MSELIIFLPGIMGTELYKGSKLVWPGSVLSLKFPYSMMEDLLDPDLQVGDIIRRFSVSEQYDALIAKLHLAGYAEKEQTLLICPYDWRKRNEDAAEKLALLISEAAEERNGEVEITLIAHSMGGLISRYYLESGFFNQRPGFSAVKNLFTLGTPHRGSPLALTAAAGLEKRLFLNAKQVQQLVQRPEFPSLYQLLPPPGDDFAWDDRGLKDLYKPFAVYENGDQLALTPENLRAARDFHSHLSGKPPAGVRYFCFAGTRMPTPTHVRIAHDPGGDNKLMITRVEVEDAGDGTVPSWSGGLLGVQGQFVGGEHGTIYKSRELTRTLGGLLGVKNTMAADMPLDQVVITQSVMTPNVLARLIISFPSSVNVVKGEVVIERVFTKEDSSTDHVTQIATYPVDYKGTGAERLGLTFKAPQDAGLYRVSFARAGGASNHDDFFIQDTVGAG
jgi:pimeloyl-ACP methyl ester carboxylesterase